VSIVQEYAASYVEQEYLGPILPPLPYPRSFTPQLEKRVQWY
jgi:hypothetical protein